LTRPLTLVALATLVLGIEVATGAVSLAGIRLWTGLNAVLFGHESLISPPRFIGGLVILAASCGMLGALQWAESARRALHPEAAVCPNCGTATKRVRRHQRHRILSRILETNVTRRRCEQCGWNGLAV
jgi:hypothetical protein